MISSAVPCIVRNDIAKDQQVAPTQELSVWRTRYNNGTNGETGCPDLATSVLPASRNVSKTAFLQEQKQRACHFLLATKGLTSK